MCVICILNPGLTPPLELIENATYNNPDGYGLILRDPDAKKLQIIRKCDETGNDPKEIYDLLKDNEDIERYLHLRNKTEGDISLENTQPFCCFHSGKREVYFMHNGTLYDYKSSNSSYVHYQHGVRVQATEKKDSPEDSDSKKFNDTFLQPLMSRIEGENGKGDIHDPVFGTIVQKFWGSAQHNRGCLISSDQGFVLINKSNWETIKTKDGDFLASNNTYFKDVIRGAEYERRKKEKERLEREAKEREEKENKNTLHNRTSKGGWPTARLKDIPLDKKYQLKSSIDHLAYDPKVWNEEGLAALSNLTGIEIEDFISKNPADAAVLFEYLSCEFSRIWSKYEKATKHLERLNSNKKKDESQERKVG